MTTRADTARDTQPARQQPRGPHRPPRCGAFTLVELLVVIAVIAILASLVLSAAFMAMDSAKQAQCRNNLAQIGRSFWLYVHTYDQWLPAIGYPVSRASNGRFLWWYDALDLLSKNAKLYRCPAKPQTKVGYGYNVRWADPSGDIHCWNKTLPVNKIKVPSLTIGFADTGNVRNPTAPPEQWKEPDSVPNDAKLRFKYRDDDPYWDLTTIGRAMPRHRGQCNFLMFDGAVQSHRVAPILSKEYGESGCLYDNR